MSLFSIFTVPNSPDTRIVQNFLVVRSLCFSDLLIHGEKHNFRQLFYLFSPPFYCILFHSFFFLLLHFWSFCSQIIFIFVPPVVPVPSLYKVEFSFSVCLYSLILPCNMKARNCYPYYFIKAFKRFFLMNMYMNCFFFSIVFSSFFFVCCTNY